MLECRFEMHAGGGGIPVARQEDGALHGVEAVVDKDFTSALLAEQVCADALLLLTDESSVYTDWPKKNQPIEETTAASLRSLDLEAHEVDSVSELYLDSLETFYAALASEPEVGIAASADEELFVDRPSSQMITSTVHHQGEWHEC